MNIVKREIKGHLFVCCNIKAEGKPSCGPKEALEVVNEIKSYLRENGLWDEFKVTKSGCLGPCAKGISATLYPQNLLLTDITKQSVPELIKLLTEAKQF